MLLVVTLTFTLGKRDWEQEWRRILQSNLNTGTKTTTLVTFFFSEGNIIYTVITSFISSNCWKSLSIGSLGSTCIEAFPENIEEEIHRTKNVKIGERGESVTRQHENITVTARQDNKTVTVLSTKSDPTTNHTVKRSVALLLSRLWNVGNISKPIHFCLRANLFLGIAAFANLSGLFYRSGCSIATTQQH